MDVALRGPLLQGSSAPSIGERIAQLVEMSGVVVEQILSGKIDEPVDYDQDHDERVVLLESAAELEVNGEKLSLVGIGETIGETR